ncbi:MAG: hypothetical protein IT323_19025, partial [Anaerolineae bacterium]|nr:hypothetical protein [Anaerolineae bacterium]
MALRTRTKTQAPVLTHADVEALSAAKNEPEWLVQARLTAWELYSAMPMPSLQDEDWRRTDYTSIRWDSASAIVNGSSAGLESIPAENRAPLIGDAQGGLICAVDGRIVESTLSDEIRRQGVIFTDL